MGLSQDLLRCLLPGLDLHGAGQPSKPLGQKMFLLIPFWELVEQEMGSRDPGHSACGCTPRARGAPVLAACLDSEQGAFVFFVELQRPCKCPLKLNVKGCNDVSFVPQWLESSK